MKNSLLAIFDEISWVIVQGRWLTFRVTLKILKNSMSNYSTPSCSYWAVIGKF